MTIDITQEFILAGKKYIAKYTVNQRGSLEARIYEQIRDQFSTFLNSTKVKDGIHTITSVDNAEFKFSSTFYTEGSIADFKDDHIQEILCNILLYNKDILGADGECLIIGDVTWWEALAGQHDHMAIIQ